MKSQNMETTLPISRVKGSSLTWFVPPSTNTIMQYILINVMSILMIACYVCMHVCLYVRIYDHKLMYLCTVFMCVRRIYGEVYCIYVRIYVCM